MALWEFVLLYLAGFALLQLVVYRWLRRRGSESSAPGSESAGPRSETPMANPAGRHAGRRDARAPASDGGATRRCPHCGTPNEPEPSYTFCRHCAGSLRG